MPEMEVSNEQRHIVSEEFLANDAGNVGESRVYSDSVEGNGRKRCSIAERRAAKCGFNASRINVARFRSASPMSSPIACSPYLTIPCGISPTALLDSPIMLPNSQPSPTTGTFPLPQNHESSLLNSASSAAVGEKSGDMSSIFTFQSHESPFIWPCISNFQNQTEMLSEIPVGDLKETSTKNGATDSFADAKVLTNTTMNVTPAALQPCHTDNQVHSFSEPINGGDNGENLLLEGCQKEKYPLIGADKTSEDGYNWRKYGQKHVKGSECPRSYYKCTNPNCLVKKKVERSLDGQITEIIYKGAHNHQIPHPSHLIGGSLASFNNMLDTGEGIESCERVEGGEVWRNIHLGSKDISVGSDGRHEGPERSSSASVLTDISDPSSTAQGKSIGIFESVGTPEFSSTLGNGNADGEDDDEDRTIQGKLSHGDDADDDKSETKRRKKGSLLTETCMMSRAMREPRVVVQIESEIDVLDDGYRWRKYGQKVVKGNPNPRSYYKCTSAGCLVRKHVERASGNLKAVITTYEGKHNHEVPASKNSTHANADVGHVPPTASNGHPNLALPRITSTSKSEAQIQDIRLHFDGKLGAEYTMTPAVLGSFGGGLKYGASSMYQANLVPFQNSMSLGSVTPVLPNFPMSLPMSIPGSASMVQDGFGFNNQGKTIDRNFSLLGGRQLRENNARFLKSKQEQEDNMFDTHLPIVDHVNSSSSLTSSSMYSRVIPNFPS